MKKIIIRSLAVMMAAIMLVTTMAGCNNNGGEGGGARPGGPGGSTVDTPEFVFVPEFINLPGNFEHIQNLVYANNSLYFTHWGQDGVSLYIMGLDGSGVRRLENFTTAQPPEGAEGNSQINGVHADRYGNLWVAESGHFFGFNLPDDFDGEDWERWEFMYEIGNVMMVRKLDGTGTEILSIDVSEVNAGPENFWFSGFNIDSDGNIYIAGGTDSGSVVHVLNSDGNLQFSLNSPNWIQQILRLPDGRVAITGWGDRGGLSLRPIDFATRTWGDEMDMPMNAWNIFPGGDGYDLIFSDSIGLRGIDAESGEEVRLLSWIDSDVLGDVSNVIMLPDGRVIASTQTWDMTTFENNTEIVIMTKVPFDSLPPRTNMSLAVFGLDHSLRNAIVNFNRTSPTHRILVTDYMEFSTQDDWQAGLTRLTTEIISGRVPDILVISPQMPFEQYVSRGLLLDLYEFIDNDPAFRRDSFMEHVFSVTEVDGGLYAVFPGFAVNTLIGNPSVVGPEPGWNMSEFRALLEAHPEADFPMGMGFTKENFLVNAIMMSMGDFVDWAGGRTHFDSPDFIELLEFANTFPDEFDWEEMWENWIDPQELIADGRQLLSTSWVSNFTSIRWDMATFGGDIVFKGFPSANRDGHVLNITGSSVAITSRASDPQGAWNFVRTILTEEWQSSNVWGFPTNRALFESRLEEAMTPEEEIYDEDGVPIRPLHRGGGRTIVQSGPGMMGGLFEMDAGPTTQQEADMIMNLINSVAGTFNWNPSLMDIITEGAQDFFAGRRTAQDAARVIQSRASIFIAEQS